MAPTMASTATMKKRFQSFLIWQSLQSTSLFLLTKLSLFLFLFLSPFTHQHATSSSSSGTPFPLLFGRLLSFLCFLVSMLVFSTCVHFISTPQFRRPALPPSLAFAFIRILFADSSSLATDDFLSRTRSSLCVVLLVSVSSLSGFVAVVSIANGGSFPALGLRGFCLGFVYGVYCVFTHRSVLTFPIVQRPPFFSYKMELLSAFRRALKLSVASLVVLILTYQHKSSIAEQCIFYLASYTVLLSWELIFQLHKILHTKRFVFAPSKGSAAVETNPSEFLLTALEGSYPRSLLQYLAYLDLCMVCGSNIDLWRRAAFFEETGETYKRVVTACLRPLQQFTLELAEGLKSSADNINKLSHQLSSPNEICRSSEILESFSDFQLYAWCAQAVASLEVHSHKEDRFGVAQLSGSHVMVLSTLLSCLLAVEASMGKKINLQSPNHIMGPAGIKWATNSTARREIATAMNKKRGSHSHTKSYALADVLKISIYSIVSEFLEEMHTSAKMGLLEKDWLSSGKPVYGSSELLLQKLQFFLNFQAS